MSRSCHNKGEIESHYNIHTELLNAFFNDSYAILILEGYMMALIKQTEFFYLIDSHARDLNGMPNPNGTAVVMNTNLFEIVPLIYINVVLSKRLNWQGCQITAFLGPNLQQCSLFFFVLGFCFLCLLDYTNDDLASKMQ